ncbi:MAG: WecB/TagA/CpsF family glycosyltransferase [Symploca sp. SIO1B1]|nr:WecB/TagA/CpsF family glycosyltransferase [Symploca sp. SIO1C2]NER92298.1 WecB/TagA/CpsF family glycosyltransferase [Symploca sp. SIO1B1]
MDTVRILNLDIDNFFQGELLEKLDQGIVFTPNVDHLINLQIDEDFRKIYDQADYKVCDSQIIFYIAKYLLKTPIKQRIAGSDFFPAFYEHHKNNENIKIFLLGAAEGVADKAKENINAKLDREIVTDTYSPIFGFEKSEEECAKIIDIVNNSEATVLAVGLGAPKQEKFICKYKDKFTKIKVFLAIGATIDFEANQVSRCPEWLSKLGFEWLYRLACDPRRLWKRYFKDLAFFGLVLKQKYNLYIEPFSDLYRYIIKRSEGPQIIPQGKTAVIQMPERLTVIEAVAFKEDCQALLQETSTLEKIVCDFSQTNFIDSSGVGALVSNLKQARAKEVELSLNGVTPPVMAVLELTGLDKVLAIDSSLQFTKSDLEEQLPTTHPSVRSWVKRWIDILGAIVGLLITAILYLPIAIAIKLNDNGPIFYPSIRCGWLGREFKTWKFRTMVVNAQELEGPNKDLGKGVFTHPDDPKITQVGRFLRKTGLDELPQFWNVLKGEMSLVGTRPPTPYEIANYEVSEWRRLNVKPGITGEWKIVDDRSQIKDFENIVKLDLDYQKDWGLLYDLRLIIRTIQIVFERLFAFPNKEETLENEH